jgi:hypothetical protein
MFEPGYVFAYLCITQRTLHNRYKFLHIIWVHMRSGSVKIQKHSYNLQSPENYNKIDNKNNYFCSSLTLY